MDSLESMELCKDFFCSRKYSFILPKIEQQWEKEHITYDIVCYTRCSLKQPGVHYYFSFREDHRMKEAGGQETASETYYNRIISIYSKKDEHQRKKRNHFACFSPRNRVGCVLAVVKRGEGRTQPHIWYNKMKEQNIIKIISYLNITYTNEWLRHD